VRKVLIVILVLCAAAAAQSRQSVAVLPSVGTLNQMDAELLTDKVREIAAKTLPQKNFMLLKLDAIINRVGVEELFRACKEGVCIGELARKASADYGARCDVSKRGDDLVLKFELYNVKEEEIVEIFTERKVKDFDEMMNILDARLPDAFRKMAEAYKEQQEAAAAAKPKPEPAAQEPPPAAVSQAKAAPVKPEPKPPKPAKPKPEPKPKREPKPPKPKPEPKPMPEIKLSAGGGVFYAGDFGGGVIDGGKLAFSMPYNGVGVYLFFDAVYAEIFGGYSGGSGSWVSGSGVDPAVDMRRTYLSGGIFAKYPIDVGVLRLFPLVGIDYEASMSFDVSAPDGRAYDFGAGDAHAGAVSALWFKFGGGVDFGVTERVYIRAELLYGVRTANQLENDIADRYSDREANPGHGVTFKVGGGVRF